MPQKTNFTKEQVLKVADLARLEFSESEAITSAEHLTSILGYVEKLSALNVDGIEPTAHAVLTPTPLRKDVVQKAPDLELSLKNAPDREGPFFKVPKVIASS